jgi:hypothetical protein
MELSDWVKVFDRLLPRSRLWGLIIDRPLKRFFSGLSIVPKTIREHLGSVLLEAFPAHTTYLHDWSEQFGALEDETAQQLAAEWGAFGGQSPAYIEGVLRDAGFDVYVHEWWDPGSDPPVARTPSPIDLVDSSLVLVNDIYEIGKNYLHQFGDNISQFVHDASVRFGAYDGYTVTLKRYPCPDIPKEYPVYFYVCGETWPEYAVVPEADFRKLIRLIFKIKPVNMRVILRISPFDDIQDVWDLDPGIDEIQDMISATDDIQDRY